MKKINNNIKLEKIAIMFIISIVIAAPTAYFSCIFNAFCNQKSDILCRSLFNFNCYLRELLTLFIILSLTQLIIVLLISLTIHFKKTKKNY